MFERILISNRGECAVRIIGTLNKMGIEAIAVHSEADTDSLHTRLADRSVCIGPPAARESYLNIENIISAARDTGAQAIHPGWGFLSEKAEFAQACHDAGIAFIGPTPEAMNHVKGKPDMYGLMKGFAPILPYVSVDAADIRKVKRAIKRAGISYPSLVKLSHGGGGFGIEVVSEESRLEKLIRNTMKRGELAFAETGVFIQQYAPDFRHIEVQILADDYGKVSVLGFRDCSLQRNFQKVVEETAFDLDSGVREQMAYAAVSLAGKIRYSGAGTVEFLAKGDEFYFLEMNKRLQVEHPVTELTTWLNGSNLDIVEWQIRIANGEHLFPESSLTRWGHAIECRIYAEDPARGFEQSPGRITAKLPNGPYCRLPVRIDSGFASNSFVPPDYDMMLDKVIAYGPDRETAIARMDSILRNFVRIRGVKTNLDYLINIIEISEFSGGNYNISTLNTNHRELALPALPSNGHLQAYSRALPPAVLAHRLSM